jgi:uncharacterized membrane protein
MNARRQRLLFVLGVVCLSVGASALFLGLRVSDTFYFALAGSFVGFGLTFVVGSLFGIGDEGRGRAPVTTEKKTT